MEFGRKECYIGTEDFSDKKHDYIYLSHLNNKIIKLDDNRIEYEFGYQILKRQKNKVK